MWYLLKPLNKHIAGAHLQARYKEVNQTTRGHFQYNNFEQRVMEYLFNEPDAFKRIPEEKIKEAMLVRMTSFHCIHNFLISYLCAIFKMQEEIHPTLQRVFVFDVNNSLSRHMEEFQQ